MSSDKETSRADQNWPRWRYGLTGLSALALALSAYLGWHYIVGGSVIGCGGGSPCDQVLNSRWSSIGGVLPVSGLAAGAYLAMLIASFFVGPSTEASVRRVAWNAMSVVAGAIAGSAVWFVIVQKWVIGSFCPYCMATHVLGLMLATLVVWRPPHTRRRMISVIGGICLAGILVACQVIFVPPSVFRGGESEKNLPAIDPHTAPLVGSADAPNIITLLFDYKCPHCQRLHFMLNEVARRYNGKLAFVLCPTPLNTKCNPHVPRDLDEFKDSCELTKVALAVWVAKREAFPIFDQWMFSLESGDHWRPRSLDAAKARAVELVGQTKLEAALADPFVDRYLQSSIQIFGATVQNGNAGIPKLILGSRWVIPEPRDADDLISILQTSLALPKP